MDADRYEQIIFIQDEASTEALAILDAHGDEAAIRFLAQWHAFGEHECRETSSEGASDTVVCNAGYILSYSQTMDYIGLQYDTAHAA